MDDWAEEKESMVPLSDEEKKSASNGDEQADSRTSVNNGGEKMAEGNGETSAGIGIIDSVTSVASKFGVAIPGHSTGEESAHKEEGNGSGIIDKLISNLPESLPMSEDEVPAAEEASLLISIIED